MRWIFALLIWTTAFTTFGQIYNPVKWTFEFEQVSPEVYDLKFIGTIDPGWFVYSQYLESDDGPIRTAIIFEDETIFSKEGKPTESGKRTEGFDQIFEMNVIKFSDQMILTQRIKISDPSQIIKGYIEYMTCDDEKCLPPAEDNFSFFLTTGSNKNEEREEEKQREKERLRLEREQKKAEAAQ